MPFRKGLLAWLSGGRCEWRGHRKRQVERVSNSGGSRRCFMCIQQHPGKGGGQQSVSKQRGRLVCARAAVPLAHAAGCSSRGGGASGLSTPKAARATARRSVRAQSHVHGCCGVPQARRKKRFATPLPPKNSRARPRQHMCGAAARARARVRAGPVIHILESPGGCEAPRGGGAVGRASRITPCAPL